MRAALAVLAVLALTALACGEPDPTTCTDDSKFDCKNACERLAAHCKEGCLGAYVSQEQCDTTSCVESCEASRKSASMIPQEQRLPVLGQFNCLDDNESCENYLSCTLTCIKLD